ncbi:DMT family transporter [Rhizobium arsenicireducens]
MAIDKRLAATRARAEFVQGLVWMALSMASFISMAVGSREARFNLINPPSLVFPCLGWFRRHNNGGPIAPTGNSAEENGSTTPRPKRRSFRCPVLLDRRSSPSSAGFGVRPRVYHAHLGRVLRLATAWGAADLAELLATLGGFLGVLVVVRPGYGVIDPAAGLVLLAAGGYGLSLILVKQLTKECSPGVIVIWMILIQLPLGLLAAMTDWRDVSLTDIPWMLVAGVGALSAHYCQAQALKRLDASVIMPIDFLRVPMAALVGFYAYGEGIDVWVVVGGGIILLSNFQAMRSERMRSHASIEQ